MKSAANFTTMITCSLLIMLTAQIAEAHEGLLPHTHGAPSGITPLTAVLVIFAIGLLIAGWKITHKRK